MNTLVKIATVSSFLAASAFAEESFGGIGVVYRLAGDGAEIQEVIPGSPAAETKIQAGDVIVAVDGESIAGKKSAAVKAALRGIENKPVVLTYVSEGDTLMETLRRVKLTVKDLNSVAEAEQADKKLLAVLENGKVIGDSDATSDAILEGVYVDNLQIPAQSEDKQVKEGTAKLSYFTRSVIRVKLEYAGAFTVSVADSKGNVLWSSEETAGHAGVNTIVWDGSLIPDGRYVVSVEHNGTVSGKNILLK